jgi:hypothetical protein
MKGSYILYYEELDKLYNFVVTNIFIRDRLGAQIFVTSPQTYLNKQIFDFFK